MLSVSEYAKKFDMAVLAQDTTESVIRTGCERARDYRVAAYYTTPTWTPLVAEILRGSDVHVGVALAFPTARRPRVSRRPRSTRPSRSAAPLWTWSSTSAP